MSDEFENSEQNNKPIDETVEVDANDESSDVDEKSSLSSISDHDSDETDYQQLAIDDPDIQASLKHLSISENADNTTVIHTPESVKNIVEAAILAASKAISLDKLLTLFPEGEVIDKSILRQAIEQLIQDYQARGIELVEVSSGFRFQVAQTVAPWVSRLWEEKPQKYSRALLETLALIAYRQPITRGEIEEIRGVSVSSHIMRTLVDREWVRVIGHRDVPGKPAMYASTKQFLDYFGLKRLDELPSLSEIRDLDIINAELDFGDANQLNVSEDSGNSEQVELDAEDNLSDELDVDQRIDIDVELAALKETYKQIDSIEPVEALEEKTRQTITDDTVIDTCDSESDIAKPENQTDQS